MTHPNTRQMTPKEVLEYYAKKGLPKDFCPVPFSTLIFEANGNVCMCRRKGNEDAIGDIRKQSYEEIWNGEYLQRVRQEFIDGKPVTCATEIRRDKCNLLADNAELLDKIDIAVVQKRPPLRLTPNFNGKCNLECKMCHVWQMENGLYDRVGFWKELEEKILPHLTEIDTFSGEPFIQKDTYRLFDLAARVNPEVVWRYTTNLNWKLNDRLRGYLDKQKIGTFTVSIDSIRPETYAEIRQKGDLALALRTLDDVIEYDKDRVARGLSSLGLVLHVVIQLCNWRELPELLEFRRKKGVKFHVRYLTEPRELSLDRMTIEQKTEVLDYYLENISGEDLKGVVRVVRPLFEAMEPLDRASRVVKFQEQVFA